MGYMDISQLWKNGIIPYDFDPASENDATFVATAQAAMLEWMSKTEIVFIPRTTEKDYIRFEYRLGAPKCSSPIGNEGGQRILYCWSNNTWGYLVHELSHTIGFVHEHQRPDRNTFVIVDTTAAKADPYDILPKKPGSRVLIGGYDCNSITHYPPDDSIAPRPGGCATIGTDLGVNLNDVKAVQSVYGFVPAAGHIHQSSAISQGPNKLAYAARWMDDTINYTSWDGSGWQSWQWLVNKQGLGITPPTLVSRTADSLDIFIRGTNKGIYHASMKNNKWQGWSRIVSGNGTGLSAISAISRKVDKIDVFVRGENNGIYTTSKTFNRIKGKGWQSWQRVGAGVASSDVTAIARKPDMMELFILGTNRGIYATSKADSESNWRKWWRIRNGRAMFGTSVAAVSRNAKHLDLFIIGENMGIYTTAWQEGMTDWKKWWRIGDIVAAPGTSVSAVSRTPHTLDIFVVGADLQVWTAHWNKYGDEEWHGFEPIFNQKVARRTGISAVSRAPNNIDLFVVGDDGRSLTAAWDGNKWKGWWPVAP